MSSAIGTAAPAIDIDAVRRDTRGVEHVTHLNNAGSSLPPAPVVDAVKRYLDAEEIGGGYETRDAFDPQIAAVYTSIARLIGANPNEIALSDSATRAWDMVFYGLHLGPGDRIVTCASEYGGNAIAYLHRARQNGADIVVVDDDDDGQIDLRKLEEALAHPRTKLLTLNHVPTQGGLINPAVEIGALARAARVPFLLDACQSIGQLDLTVAALQCDVLTGTGRKYLRGPRGTGFLYIRPESMKLFPPAFLDGRSASWARGDTFELAETAIRYETWEKSYANLLGLGAAVDYALSLGMKAIEARILELGAELRDSLRLVSSASILDRGIEQCGIVSFTLGNADPDTIMSALRRSRINVSVSRARSSRWDLPRRGLQSVVRASVHYYNTTEEIELLASTLSNLRRAGEL